MLAGLPGLEIPSTDLASVSPWFVDVLVDRDVKRPLMEHLQAHGIGSRPVYPPLHAEPAFTAPGCYPIAEDLSARGLWLPSSLRLDDEQVARVCETIRRFIAG